MRGSFKRIFRVVPKSFIDGVILCLLFVLVVELHVLFLPTAASFVSNVLRDEGNLAGLAEKAIDDCKDSTYRPSCYDKEIPKLTEKISMEKAFTVTRLVQEEDGEYWYCHVLGHELSSRETAKDPDAWKTVVSRCPSGMCSNGCLHGAFQERFRTDGLPDVSVAEIKPELLGICDERENWSPTGLERATCVHALGHLTMYITVADIHKATTLCDELELRKNNSDLTQLCYDGAFMQLFQPLDPEDFTLVEGKVPKKEELRSFCKQFKDKKQSSCWSEGWPLYLAQIKKSQGLVAFCGEMKNNSTEYKRCLNAMFYVLTAQFNFDEKKVIDFCSELPKEHQGSCFSNAASRLIETDWRLVERSVDVCMAAKKLGVDTECFDELLFYSKYNFKKGSPEFTNLCNKLPFDWRDRCLAEE